MQYKVKQIRDPVYERARWTQDPDKVSRRVTKWRQKAWYDKEVEKFSLSKARVDNEDHLWEVCLFWVFVGAVYLMELSIRC